MLLQKFGMSCHVILEVKMMLLKNVALRKRNWQIAFNQTR